MLKANCKILYSNYLKTCELPVNTTIHSFWHSVYNIPIASLPDNTEQFTILLNIDNHKTWYLSPERKLVELTSETCPIFPVGRFIIIESGDSLFLLDLPWAGRLRLRRRQQHTEIVTHLQDRRRCGLSYWGQHKFTSSRPNFSLNIYQNRLNSLSECIWLEPYPNGANAALCLTDHADYDSEEKLSLLADLFIKNNIQICKSVFPVAEPKPAKHEPGLDLPGYRKIIEKLFAHGNEIAFHSFSPRARTPSLEECRHRANMLTRFQAKTWIDHGAGSYLFSRTGKLTGGLPLTDFLQQYGIKNYWSYFDICKNSFYNLSCYEPPINKYLTLNAIKIFKNIKPKTLGHTLYILQNTLKNIIGEMEANQLVKEPFSAHSWLAAQKGYQTLKNIRNSPFIIYGLDGANFPATPIDSIWIFDTLLINYLSHQLQPTLIEKLCQESGLLIAHCYLCNEHKYIGNDCFINDNNSLILNQLFVNNIEYISYKQTQRTLVTLSFAQLRRYLENFTNSFLIRLPDGWLINKKYDHQAVLAGNRQAVDSLSGSISEKWSRDNLSYIRLHTGQQVKLKMNAGN